jgi:WD40 repeat protein
MSLSVKSKHGYMERYHTSAALEARNVLHLAWSHTGLLVATGGRNQTVGVWDATSGEMLNNFRGHSGYISSVAFSHNDVHIVSASIDRTVRIWDTESDDPGRVLLGHTECVTGAEFSPDDSLIASTSFDRSVRLWDFASTTLVRVLGVAPSILDCMAWSLDGKRVVTGSRHHMVHVWNVARGTLDFQVKDVTSSVYSVAWSPDGLHFATGNTDGSVQLFDAKSGNLLKRFSIKVTYILQLQFAKNGWLLASGLQKIYNRRLFCICDPKSGQSIFDLPSLANFATAALSPDAQTIVCAFENLLCFFDFYKWSPRTNMHFEQPVKSAVFLLMCVYERLQFVPQTQTSLPFMSLDIWMEIVRELVCIVYV